MCFSFQDFVQPEHTKDESNPEQRSDAQNFENSTIIPIQYENKTFTSSGVPTFDNMDDITQAISRNKRDIVSWIPSIVNVALQVIWTLISLALSTLTILFSSIISWFGFGSLFSPFLFLLIKYMPFVIPTLTLVSDMIAG